MAIVEIDYIEYSSDASAQSAYITSVTDNDIKISDQVNEGGTAVVNCPAGTTIVSYVSEYGVRYTCGPVACGSCTISASSCSVNFNNTNCGDPCYGTAKKGYLDVWHTKWLQCYSESAIKNQGSYSLKIIATITDSLNKTLTRTISPTVDLTGKNWIKFDIRASRTGSNIKIGFHNSNGTTTEITPNITSSDVFQTIEYDVSSVSNTDKDAIDSIIITVLNADSTTTYYIDNMYGETLPPPTLGLSSTANIWTIDNFIFKTLTSGVKIYNGIGIELGFIEYVEMDETSIVEHPTSVWANNNYLYISTTNSGVLRSPMSSISGAVYNDLSVYKTYPDINNEHVNYVHGKNNYLCVATISGAHIFDLTTNSGIYTSSSLIADKCYQMSNRTSYYIYDNKLETVYNDNSTYVYQSGDGIIPTISGMNDLYVVSGTKNLILLGTTDGAVVIEENKGNEASSRFKYYYIEE